MSQVAQILPLLESYLKALPELAEEKDAFKLVEYNNSPVMMLKKYLQNQLYTVLITVQFKEAPARSYEYNLKARDKVSRHEITIWLKDNPMYREESLTPVLNLFSQAIEQFFDLNRKLGTVRNTRNASYANGQTWYPCHVITITRLIE